MDPKTSGDHALWILAGGLIFYTFVVIGIAVFLPKNDALSAQFAGILGGFAGGLWIYLRVKPTA